MNKTHFINTEFITAAAAAMPDAPTTADERTLTGLVLPFGREGRTSAGLLSVTAGAISMPEDIGRIKLYRDHSDVGGTPVGKATSVEVKDDGIYMSFRVGKTPDGDAAIADVVEGIRDALSVELVDTVTAGGVLSAGTLTAVALVPVPAFDDARITSAFVKDDEDEDTEENDTDKPKTTASSTAMRSTLTTRLATSRVTAATRKDTMNLENVAATIAGKINGDTTITAALATVTQASQPAVVDQEWLGELFNTAPFERLIVPTMKQRTLTQMKLKGWRWTDRPEVDDYSGNLTEIPTNAIKTEPVEADAKRIAGGHKIDRKFIDFADNEFIQSYLREMTDSYKMKTDARAAEFIIAEADKVATAGKQPTLLHAAAKANQVIFKKLRKYATTFLVNPEDLFKLFDITMMDEPRYLELFKIDPASFIPDERVEAGHVVAYHKDSLAWGELPGSPIRVDALDVAHGGSDNALFGYWAALVEDARGLTVVSFGTVAA
ncbi:hypothetical protein HMPREF2976_04270 [Corynebacterium sp. HMSC077D10]|uniref:phage major capsid protein n=1 Tax=unclassified Corynebacterium TaxID=2624378 RepID=UPI0008A3CC51|nr:MULTISPECIES: hypothetical protein [unclassified Corynebacterium]OFP20311.1 hypothetical protein HMPREF2998_07940 [Corynebacterium sp. HMSC065A05]OFP64661.1 hypothetical protein HMPREF2976_04270 [Corynebacterium sp. HMSC077D10]